MEELVRFDLGCGNRLEEGWKGVDIAPIPGVIQHDLRLTPWPFADDEVVDEVKCVHFFEHLTGEERMRFMDELHRVLKPGAQAQIIVPDGNSNRAVQDPTHQWPPVVPESFLYFNKQWRDDNGLSHYNIEADFDFSYGFNLAPHWLNKSDEARAFALGHYRNVASDLVVTLTKR